MSAEFTTRLIPPPDGALDDPPDNFGIAEDTTHVPDAVWIAFKAPSRAIVDALAQRSQHWARTISKWTTVSTAAPIAAASSTTSTATGSGSAAGPPDLLQARKRVPRGLRTSIVNRDSRSA